MYLTRKKKGSGTSVELITRIDQLRNTRHWTEYQLAKRAGISQSTLSNLIHRGNNPSMYTVERIAKAFDLSLAQFFSDEEDPHYLTGDQRELLDYWHAMDRFQKEKVLCFIKGLLKI